MTRMPRPLSLAEAMLLASNSEHDSRVCISCGGDAVEWGLALLDYEVPQLAAAAWCDETKCQEDKTRQPVITVPVPSASAAVAAEPVKRPATRPGSQIGGAADA